MRGGRCRLPRLGSLSSSDAGGAVANTSPIGSLDLERGQSASPGTPSNAMGTSSVRSGLEKYMQ